jgi:hypothetical protein
VARSQRTNIAKHGSAANELQHAFPKCLISLPKTGKEKEMVRAFLNWKWGGGSIAIER